MARQNQKSEFVSGLGKGFEFVKAISDQVRELGGSDDDLSKVISQTALSRKIAEIILGRVSGGTSFPSLTIAADLIPQGYEIVEDIAPSKFEVSNLELVSFLEKGEEYVRGEVVHKRAVNLKANLGLADAKYILDHQAEIPPEFRNKYLVFTGTVLRGPDGSLYVAYLDWDGSRWVLRFNWLGNGWDVHDRLVRSK